MSHRLLLFTLLLLSGIFSSHTLASGSRAEKKVEWKKTDLHQGYALLYGIAEKQKSVDMLLIVKNASTPTAALIKEISRTYGELHGYLKPLAINGQLVAKSSNGLPLAETSSRDRIQRIKTEQLLSRSGPFFDLTLLSTQVEALTYSSALLSHIAEQDPSSANKEKALAYQQKLDGLLKKIWQQIEKLQKAG